MLRGMLKVCFVVCVALSMARKSPEANRLREILKRIPRHSDNVFEDAQLDVPELITKYRYPVQIHRVRTEDGYILEMHRIYNARDSPTPPSQKRPVVFVMHGLLSSSADFVIMGPGSGLAYILAEEGYDVWLGNARGSTYSRKHVVYNPDALWSTRFWQFSWDEIGNLDLPAMIDYTLQVSDQQRLHYIGHSQGTTTFFVFGSLRPDYNKKIISMHALAPVAFMAHNRSIFFNFLARFVDKIEVIGRLIGVGEFFQSTPILQWAGQAACRDDVIFQPVCSNILFLIGGWNENQQNTTMMPAIFGHAPAGASVRQFVHYAQGLTGKDFRRYDMGTKIANYKRYRSNKPPRYELSKNLVPVFLHYSDSDPLAHVKDVYRLYGELGNAIAAFRIPMSSFSHVDFLFGIDAKELVYDKVINITKTIDVYGIDGIRDRIISKEDESVE